MWTWSSDLIQVWLSQRVMMKSVKLSHYTVVVVLAVSPQTSGFQIFTLVYRSLAGTAVVVVLAASLQIS